MKNKRLLAGLTALGLIAGFTAQAAAMGEYVRTGKKKDAQIINVTTKGGKLFCTRASDGFEMCHGMSKQGDAWKGKGMKHPDMPKFMTFNGTVAIGANSLSITGCAFGESMCDKETWAKK
jgi:hypothetical protein